MPYAVEDVGLMANGMVLVRFSNDQSTYFTAGDLISLARFLKTPDLVTVVPEAQGITLCTDVRPPSPRRHKKSDETQTLHPSE